MPILKPTSGKALLRSATGRICGTDLHIFQGHLDHRLPRGGILGHDAEVMETPHGSGFQAGDRVVVEPLLFLRDLSSLSDGASCLCYDLKVLGADVTGGMQEYWTVPVSRCSRFPPP